MKAPPELVPPSVSESDLKSEVNRRTHKAGYTDRDGQMMDRPKIRSMRFSEQGRRNYVAIFGHE